MRKWPVEQARAWCLRVLGDVPIPLADEADFRMALRNWDYDLAEIDRAAAEVYAAAERERCPIDHGKGDACADCDPNGQPDLEALESTGPCPKCGAQIVTYNDVVGLLPDEYIDGRRATHSWLVCQLRAEARAKADTTPHDYRRLDLDALEAKACLLSSAAANATRGPWRWWTSCSFRRLSSDPSGKDGDVAHARIAHDGVPDISIREEDMHFIESACNSARELADAVLALSVEVRRLDAMAKRARVVSLLGALAEAVTEAQRWPLLTTTRARVKLSCMSKLLVSVSVCVHGVATIVEVFGEAASLSVNALDGDLYATEVKPPKEPGIYVWEGTVDTDGSEPEYYRWHSGKWRFPNAEECAKISRGEKLWGAT